MIPPDEEILRALVDRGDDGFVPRHQLVARFRGLGERDMRRAIGRTARRGLLLERKDPEGRRFLAVSSEGWEALRSGRFEPRRLRARDGREFGPDRLGRSRPCVFPTTPGTTCRLW